MENVGDKKRFNYTGGIDLLFLKTGSLGLVAMAAPFLLSACAAVDVSDELSVVSEAANAIDKSVRTASFNARLKANQETVRQYRLDVSARDQHLVAISDGCRDLRARREGASTPSCVIETIVPVSRKTPSIEPPPVNAIDVDRKLQGISSYLGALSALANATTETDIQNAYAAAIGSFQALADEAAASEIAALVKSLNENKETFDAAVTFAVQNQRARRLKSVVLSQNGAFQTVVRETEAKLIALAVDLDYVQALDGLIDTDEQTLFAYGAVKLANDAGDMAALATAEAAYRAQLDALYAAERRFTAARDASVYGKLSALRVSHAALAERLSRPASVDETLTFLDSIKAIADTL